MTDYLFIHQNFPGQYKHLAPTLAGRGHRVVALTPRVQKPTKWHGVDVLPYRIRGRSTSGLHPWLVDMEAKTLRGHSCYLAARELKEKGLSPDVILAHPGWGESLFLKDLWPEARMGLYCELYYGAGDSSTGFDPEFARSDDGTERLRMRYKNLANRLHFEVMDAGISPTRFQADTFPQQVRSRISVIHDGIDTRAIRANPEARLDVGEGQFLTREDEVVTFINRNLEPYRGYHVFMRALPELLRRRPNARVVLIGGDSVSYGARPEKGKTWKQIFIDEVRPQIPDDDWARVHFLGRVPYDRFLAFLQVSRAHVYLTYPFVLSWSLLEAMSAGAPIVASDTAPVREVLSDGENALLVDFFDRDEIVNSVCELLDDAALCDELTATARADVVEKYDLRSRCLPQLLEWVEKLERFEPRPPMV